MADDFDLERLSAVCRGAVAGADDVVAVYLFGSRARGDERPDSDVDLGILFHRSQGGLDRLIDFETELERQLGYRVDTVDVGRASPFLALDVIRGERIACSDPVAGDLFELYVMRRAADLAPFERERRRLAMRPGNRTRSGDVP